MQYLTIIGLSLAALTFTAGLAADLTRSTLLFRIKNYLSAASAPIEVLVSVLYWSLNIVRATTASQVPYADPNSMIESWCFQTGLHVLH